MNASNRATGISNGVTGHLRSLRPKSALEKKNSNSHKLYELTLDCMVFPVNEKNRGAIDASISSGPKIVTVANEDNVFISVSSLRHFRDKLNNAFTALRQYPYDELDPRKRTFLGAVKRFKFYNMEMIICLEIDLYLRVSPKLVYSLMYFPQTTLRPCLAPVTSFLKSAAPVPKPFLLTYLKMALTLYCTKQSSCS